MSDFKPSQVRLWHRGGVLPLIDTFGHSETEFAAALMALACRTKGDQWGPVSPVECGVSLLENTKVGGCFEHLRTNPFMPMPDVWTLVKEGYAEFVGEPEKPGGDRPAQFTQKGLDVLRTTVRA